MTARPVPLHVDVPRRRIGVLATTLAVIGVLLAPAPARAADHVVARLGGANRYQTAATVAGEFAPGVDRVFLATGEDFPDALAAGPVAGRLDVPILLVRRGRIPAATADALRRLRPGAITVLGGTAAVSNTVRSAAAAYTDGPVDRVRGPDRNATAAALVDRFVPGRADVVWVASGRGFADSLAAVPAAIERGAPLLLVTRTGIPPATRATLDRLQPARIRVVGGSAAVSDQVLTGLGAYAEEVVRISGSTRYGTSADVVRRVFPGRQRTAWLASGETFADALAGGVPAGIAGQPLVTTRRDCVPPVVLAQLERMQVQTVKVLGGTGAVSTAAAQLVSCAGGEPPRPTNVQVDLSVPWDVVSTPDGRTFFTERDRGRVLERRDDGTLRTVRQFAVDDAGEGGLLGLAVSPRYASDRWLYAMYVTTSDQRIVRFRPDGTGTQVVVQGLPDGRSGNSTHFGGRIDFGPDGMLYVSVGDTQVQPSAQDRSALSGKILRYTPGGGVPADNPFGNPVWAYGFRDPQGMAWDAGGRMFATEFGPDRDDEINRVRRGRNYGWPEVTGRDGGDSRYDDPLVVRQPAQASWSGATVLLDGSIPEWEGDLFVAALRGERLYRVDLDDGRVRGVHELLVGDYGRLRHVTRAPDGSLWILTSNRDGRGDPLASDDRIVRLGPP